MKGLFFVEFLDFVAHRFGEDMCDDIIDELAAQGRLETDGAYTLGGIYSQAEFALLIGALGRRAQIPEGAIRTAFAGRLFDRARRYLPEFFDAHATLSAFLQDMNAAIGAELRKIYGDSHIPMLKVRALDDGGVEIVHHSRCAFLDFAPDLLMACAAYYGRDIDVTNCKTCNGGLYTCTYQLKDKS